MVVVFVASADNRVSVSTLVVVVSKILRNLGRKNAGGRKLNSMPVANRLARRSVTSTQITTMVQGGGCPGGQVGAGGHGVCVGQLVVGLGVGQLGGGVGVGHGGGSGQD